LTPRRERLQDAAGVRIEIDDVLHDGQGEEQTVSPLAGGGFTSKVPWTIAAAFALALTFLITRPEPRGTSPSPIRFRVPLEDARLQEYDVPELSPDGRHIAYVASHDHNLWLLTLPQ